MPYARRSVRSNSLGGTGRSTQLYKRRSSAVRKVWRKKPTAKNQQSQIAAVTRLALANRRRFQQVYTDYQTQGNISIASGGTTWNIIKLTDFSVWNPTLRQNQNVASSNHTFIKRLQLNLLCFVNSGYTLANIFIVRPRYSNAFPLGAPVLGEDYIQGPSAGGEDVRLNSGKWKVLFSMAKMLGVSTVGQASGIPQYPGNFGQSFFRKQINLNVNIKVSMQSLTTAAPTSNSWKLKQFDDLPYYDKLYLMVLNSGTGSEVTYDQLATCINSI